MNLCPLLLNTPFHPFNPFPSPLLPFHLLPLILHLVPYPLTPLSQITSPPRSSLPTLSLLLPLPTSYSFASYYSSHTLNPFLPYPKSSPFTTPKPLVTPNPSPNRTHRLPPTYLSSILPLLLNNPSLPPDHLHPIYTPCRTPHLALPEASPTLTLRLPLNICSNPWAKRELYLIFKFLTKEIDFFFLKITKKKNLKISKNFYLNKPKKS